MTPVECVKLARLVKSVAPAQAFDEFTPDVWHALLSSLRFEDAAEAVRRVAQRQAFIAPADIIAEVRALRRGRLDRADATFVATCDPDDVEEYQRQLAAHRRRMGDDDAPTTRPALPAGRPLSLTAGRSRQ